MTMMFLVGGCVVMNLALAVAVGMWLRTRSLTREQLEQTMNAGAKAVSHDSANCPEFTFAPQTRVAASA